MEPLPFEILDAMIQCFGRAFHYKDPMASFLIGTGVSRPVVDKYKHEPKFVWARHLLTELGESDEGRITQRKVLTALCRLRNLPDPAVEDRNVGLEALRTLKKLAVEHDLVVREDIEKRQSTISHGEEQVRLVQERATKLQKLRDIFNANVVRNDRQAAGYSLEDLLVELFSLFEIQYKRPYKTPTQQIDGYFSLDGFDYLVEARWRKEQPTEGKIGEFQRKVNTKLESTRGLFVSIVGFREEVATQFNGQGANIILMDGVHLTHILEGRIDLREALRFMIETAVQKGVVYTGLFCR